MSLRNFPQKFESFGFETVEIDGHDYGQIHDILSQMPKGKPKAVIANTIKGKGISFMENVPIWHYRIPNENELKIALEELGMTSGDLGEYGLKLMKLYFKKISKNVIENVIDSGSIFYKDDNIYAGSSGPACLPLILFDYIIPSRKYKKILIIGTGSMHSVTSCNLNIPIPAIAHAVSLEVS